MVEDVVIIGAGLCGTRAALALREKGFKGGITLVGDEAISSYDRPPLSKQVLSDDAEIVPLASEDDYQAADVAILRGTAAVRIDRTGKSVLLDDGRSLGYGRLLLATGARARTLPGISHRRLTSLRTHEDAKTLQSYLGPERQLIVIGGGFIGLEVAAAARKRGTKVILLESLPRLMARAVPEEIASIVEARHRAEGVEIILNARIASIEEDANGIVVSLEDGRTFKAHAGIVGIGAVPNTGLAEECGLAVENGVCVDNCLRTSDPDIFAAGDCCSFPQDMYSGRRLRLESWRSAQNQGILAAANIVGNCRPITDLPWFWSDQFDLSLQIVGLPDMGVRTVRRDIDDGAFLLFHLDGLGRLVGASGIGRFNAVARDIRLVEMMILANIHPTADALATPSIRLKSLLSKKEACQS